MDVYDGAKVGQTRESLQLKQRILDLEQVLGRCGQEREAAQKSEQRFRTFSERVLDYAFITFDEESRIMGWSRGAQHILGYTEAEILGQPASVLFTDEDRSNGEAETELAMARSKGCAEDERWHRRQDGTHFWGSGVMTAHRDARGHLEGYSKVMRDLTSRRVAEQKLRDAEERFRLFADNVRDYALVPVDTEAKISGWNSGAERIFGYTEKEIVGRHVGLVFTPEDEAKGASEKNLSRALAEGRSEDDCWMMRRDGSRFWARSVTRPMHDSSGNLRGFAKVLRDETERKRAEDLIRKSLCEKDLLLREIHHRIKNNLNVVSSLISLQSSHVEDGEVQRMFLELQDRIRSIATLHEALYGSNNLAHIEYGPYMQRLVHDLIEFHEIDRERIQVRAEADDVVLSIEQALPLGLIVSELVSNALKHAFPSGRRGLIQIRFRYLGASVPGREACDAGWCELSVHDDGAGIGNPDALWQGKSMGLQIVRLLTDQLQGRITLDSGGSTCFTVQFPLEDCRSSGAGAVTEEFSLASATQ